MTNILGNLLITSSKNIRNLFSAALAEGAFSLLFSHPTIVWDCKS